MSDYILSCCSTADLSENHFRERNISYICFHYELDGVSYPDDLGKTKSFDEFYKAMSDGAETKTSQINVEEFETYFEKFLKDGKDIVHLCLSSGITGVMNSALIARDNLKEKYPQGKIFIIDSLAASSGYGLLMDKLADLRDAGYSAEELVDWAQKNKLKVQHWFFTTDLTFFIKGGRVSKTAGFLGGLLNICPLLTVDVEGKLVVRHKIKGKSRIIRETAKKMQELVEDGRDYSEKVYISHSACFDDARAVADIIEEDFPQLKGKVEINHIGTTIGSHSGPGTVALFFWGKERMD